MADEVKESVEGCEGVTGTLKMTWDGYLPPGIAHVQGVPVGAIRALLRAQGLHIVGEAEMRVLESLPPKFVLDLWLELPSHDHRHRIAVARRAAKKEMT